MQETHPATSLIPCSPVFSPYSVLSCESYLQTFSLSLSLIKIFLFLYLNHFPIENPMAHSLSSFQALTVSQLN